MVTRIDGRVTGRKWVTECFPVLFILSFDLIGAQHPGMMPGIGARSGLPTCFCSTCKLTSATALAVPSSHEMTKG